MTTHFSQDEFILAYYRESDIDARREHLDACDECRAELVRLAGVLDQVTPAEIPEPADDYEARVWDRMSWRLRGATPTGATTEEEPSGETGSQPVGSISRVAGRAKSPSPQTNQTVHPGETGSQPVGLQLQKTKADGLRARLPRWLAAAAMLAVAFIGGLLWNRSNNGPVHTANKPASTPNVEPTAASTQQQRDRILLVVVGDHLDDSERMLLELTNLTPKEDVDVSTEQHRAEELLLSNRLYRRTALDRGEDRVATLLDELEPVLMQIAHGPSQMTPDELRKVQKRVETKGLVFKLRVLRADVRATAMPHLPSQPNI